MSAATKLLLASVLFAIGCDSTVDDGKWTYTWRLDGHELTEAWVQTYESCHRGSQGVNLMRHMRSSKDAVCRKLCGGPAPSGGATTAAKELSQETQACLYSCDANTAFVTAHCDPTTHVDKSPLFAR